MRLTNIHIIGVPEGKEEQKGPEKVFEEIIAENFCNMEKETVIYIQAESRVPYRVIPQKKALGRMVMNLFKFSPAAKTCTCSSKIHIHLLFSWTCF